MAPKRSHRPVRTCVACRQEAGKADLLRIVRRPDGGVELDPTGRAAGRGAYLHAASECVGEARKRRSLDRALGATVPPELWALLPAQGFDSAPGGIISSS